jgi:hypothetical protein
LGKPEDGAKQGVETLRLSRFTVPRNVIREETSGKSLYLAEEVFIFHRGKAALMRKRLQRRGETQKRMKPDFN